VNEESDE